MPGLINFNIGGRDPLTLFKVGVSESFTVPDSVTTDSPTDTANFDSIRAVAGGQLLVSFDDVAGDAVQDIGQLPLEAGDVIACSAVGVPAANDVTVTITSPAGTVRTVVLAGVTADGGVIGYYG